MFFSWFLLHNNARFMNFEFFQHNYTGACAILFFLKWQPLIIFRLIFSLIFVAQSTFKSPKLTKLEKFKKNHVRMRGIFSAFTIILKIIVLGLFGLDNFIY